MPVKTILLPLCETDEPGPVLETALSLAQRFGAHLDILYVRRDPLHHRSWAQLGVPKHLRETVSRAADINTGVRVVQTRQLLECYCAEAGVPVVADRVVGGVSAGWQEITGQEDCILAVRGRLSDLIVLPGPIPVAPPPAVAEAALKSTGRPVLIAPPRPEPVIGTRIGIGWNGSAQAAHAVAAAMAYIAAAEAVTVYTCRRYEHTDPTPLDLVKYLSWHGVKAQVRTIDAHDPHVGEALLAAAAEDDVNLLVVGAYSRSRLRELVLGGVTEHVMTSAEIPVFMLH
jgi:nucleotide-binding universal stress UspA family protein